MNPAQNHVFVSYAHDDADLVLPEIDRLEATGFEVWYDRSITPGSAWREEVAIAIEQCEAFLFFITPNSINSAYCQREVDFALDMNKRILCVHLSDVVMTPGQTMSLMDRQHIYRSQLSEQVYEESLLAGLTSQTGTAPNQQVLKAKTNSPAALIVGLVLAVAITFLGWWFWPESTPDTTDKKNPSEEVEVSSIAVMPFTATGKNSEATSIGVHADVLSYLARLRGLAVISIDSLNRMQAEDASTPEIAEALDVRYVMRGTLQLAGDRLRLNLTLLDGANGQITWTETYDRTIEDLFAVQAEVAASVARQLTLELGVDDVAALNRPPTANLDAWRLYQQAATRSNTEAVPLLREAITLDPEFAPALADLAWRLNRRNHPDTDEIRGYAHRAADLSPGDARTIAILGQSYALDDPLTADKYFQQARALDPLWGSEMIAGTRFWLHADLDGALDEFDRALRLNPLNPSSAHGFALLANRENDSALRHVAEIERISPNHYAVIRVRAFVAESRNNLAEAIQIASDPRLRRFDDREPLTLFLNAIGLQEQAAAAIRTHQMDRFFLPGSAAVLRDTGRIEELQARLPPDAPQYRWIHAIGRQYALITAARGGVTPEIRDQLRVDIEDDDAFMRERYSRYAHIPAWFLRHDLPVEGLVARKLAGMEDSLQWLIEAMRYALDNGGTFELPKREHFILGVAAALEGDIDEAVVQFELAHEYGLRNLAGMAFFGLIEDPNGIYGGLTDDPRYRALLKKIRAANDLTRSILAQRAPELLDKGFLSMPLPKI